MRILLLLFFFSLSVLADEFPAEWFKEVPRSEAAGWEILPQDAKPGEVILSKRSELGIFSNLGAASFTLEGKKFASVEALWQSLKYPDLSLSEDPRTKLIFPHTRAEVEEMVGFEAKDAGNEANRIYKKNGLKNISWGNHFFDYVDHAEGSQYHYELIKRAMRAKLDQNPELWNLLLKTKCLILKPDHVVDENDPPAYHYNNIYMELREESQRCTSQRKPSNKRANEIVKNLFQVLGNVRIKF